MSVKTPKQLILSLTLWQLATLRALIGAQRGDVASLETGIHLRALLRLKAEDSERIGYEEHENGTAAWKPEFKDERFEFIIEGRPSVRMARTVFEDSVKKSLLSVDEWTRHGRDLAERLGIEIPKPTDDEDDKDEDDQPSPNGRVLADALAEVVA